MKMKTFMVALSIVALLFAQVPVAEAVSFKDVKSFLVGSDVDREEGEKHTVQTGLLGASALQALTADHELSISPPLEEGELVEISEGEEVVSFVFEIERGDTLWDRIEAELEVAFPEMSVEQENFIIDSIIDEMRTLSGGELSELGVSSGNVDLIFPDEVISFNVTVSGESFQDVQVEAADSL